jgi:serine kinase of HPr protein (carbohydrate metabolism regulator)
VATELAAQPIASPVHATSVAIDGRAVLIEGPSGAGKSDLALRLIDRGATLVSDDQTVLTPSPAGPLASAPATIAGRIEVRGLGIVTLPYAGAVPVRMIVELSPAVERMPDPRFREIGGVAVPVIVVHPCAASAPIKVEWALRELDSWAAP